MKNKLLLKNLLLPIIMLTLVAGPLAGCSKKNKAPKERKYYYLTPGKLGGKDIYVTKKATIVDTDYLYLYLKPLKPLDVKVESPLLALLIKSNFTLFRIDIDNKGKKVIAFNPAFTSLYDDKKKYSTPMDYTDLYSVAQKFGESGDRIMRDVRREFYDTLISIKPGDKVSRILIFDPVREKSKNAVLSIKELYIGEKPIHLRIPYTIAEDARAYIDFTRGYSK